MTPPSLPTLRDLPRVVLIDGCVGYLFAQVAGTNPNLMTLIFSVRGIAELFFSHIANYSLKKTELDSHKIHIGVSMIVNMTFLVALRELKLIGQLSAIAFGIAILGRLSKRVSYVDKIEKEEEANKLNHHQGI